MLDRTLVFTIRFRSQDSDYSVFCSVERAIVSKGSNLVDPDLHFFCRKVFVVVVRIACRFSAARAAVVSTSYSN